MFMMALAVVAIGKAAAAAWAGRTPETAGAAMLIIAMIAQELERRGMARGGPALEAVRWAGLLGALAFLL